jgi:hypothetical protein
MRGLPACIKLQGDIGSLAVKREGQLVLLRGASELKGGLLPELVGNH